MNRGMYNFSGLRAGNKSSLYSCSTVRGAVIALFFLQLFITSSARALQPISLSLRNMEISEVMEMLSRQHRVNILMSDQIKGTISVNLYDVGLEEAIRSIANAAGYELEQRGKNYFIIKRDEVGKYSDAGTTRVTTHKLRYATANDVSEILEQYVSQYGKITALEDRNVLVVEDKPEFLQRIELLIDQLDYQPRQILIEARILEIQLGEDEAFGIEWTRLFETGGMEGLVGTSGFSSPDAKGLLFQLVGDKFELYLDALQNEGRTKTLSTPKLLALENKQASVIIGDRLGYLNTVTINQVTTETTEFLESGVILKVKPTVDDKNRIIMQIHPEVSTGTINEGIPSQTTTAVDTNLLVPSGATVFIGGLIKSQKIFNQTGVQGLRKIPVLGALFSRTEERQQNSEIIVLITPTLIDTPDSDWQRREISRVQTIESEISAVPSQLVE